MSNATQTVRIRADNLAQEATLQSVLDKLCDLQQTEDGWFEGASATATVGSEATIFTSTAVPGGENRWISQIYITSDRAGKFRILKGATEIGSGRTGPGVKNIPFLFLPGYKFTATETVEVKFEQYFGTAQPVEVRASGIQK